MSDSGGYKPAATINTATDRELAFERGLAVGYLDTALDALSHLLERTKAGRAWLVSDDNLEEVLSWLTSTRAEMLRKERVDDRSARNERGARPLPEAIPWLRGANVRE